eukprot:COSAG04_NODE_4195_length_2241_cov_2.802054_2_plen_211_part_00
MMLLLAAAAAAAASCPEECSLNGACVGGECHCTAPWSGPSCGVLRTAPARLGGLYGYAPNISSWGGSLVTDAAGTHHLFAAQIPGGLIRWGSNSECIHAVSDDVQGPFTLKDIALKPWCPRPPGRDRPAQQAVHHGPRRHRHAGAATPAAVPGPRLPQDQLLPSGNWRRLPLRGDPRLEMLPRRVRLRRQLENRPVRCRHRRTSALLPRW